MGDNIASLTSLRFFAAFAVVLEHYFGFRFGHAGVSFFYILSGFILTYNYHDRVSSPGDVRKFFERRFARIYPLHIVTLCAAIPTALLIDFRSDWGRAGIAAIANTFLVQSFFVDRVSISGSTLSPGAYRTKRFSTCPFRS